MTHDITPKLLNISIGSHVQFTDDDGNTLRGTVFHLLPCLTNGRKHAVIEIDSELLGITHTVPVDQLTEVRSVDLSLYNQDLYAPSVLDPRRLCLIHVPV